MEVSVGERMEREYFDDFVERRHTVKANVILLLQKFPCTRDDYRKLVWFYWWYIDGIKKIMKPNGFIPIEKFPKLTPPESITRAYREVMNDPLKREAILRVSPEVKIIREMEEEAYHKYYSRKDFED